MPSFLIRKAQTAILGSCVMAIVLLSALSLAADDDGFLRAPSQGLDQLAVPIAPGSFAVAEHEAPLKDTITGSSADTCVERLDEHIAPMLITFAPGDAQVGAEHAPLLSHIAALVTACADAHVLIAGHADGSGDDATNLALSWQRADEILNLLTSLGADPTALESIGYGARVPMAQGSDDEDDANRRVDFRAMHKRHKP